MRSLNCIPNNQLGRHIISTEVFQSAQCHEVVTVSHGNPGMLLYLMPLVSLSTSSYVVVLESQDVQKVKTYVSVLPEAGSHLSGLVSGSVSTLLPNTVTGSGEKR